MNAQDWQVRADHLQALALQSNPLPGFDTWADFWKACDSAALAAERDGAQEEYAPLLRELESLGYRVKVVSRIQPNMYHYNKR